VSNSLNFSDASLTHVLRAIHENSLPTQVNRSTVHNDQMRENASDYVALSANLKAPATDTTDETSLSNSAQPLSNSMAPHKSSELLTLNKDDISQEYGQAISPRAHVQVEHDKCTSSHSPSSAANGHWDSAVANFLRDAGLTQALRGFEADMIILNPEWERSKLPQALNRLVTSLVSNSR
jgi:hypothetical protein